jgi:hypothetical protein
LGQAKKNIHRNSSSKNIGTKKRNPHLDAKKQAFEKNPTQILLERFKTSS